MRPGAWVHWPCMHLAGRLGAPHHPLTWLSLPAPHYRYKKTVICQEVAKAKNVCQVRRVNPTAVDLVAATEEHRRSAILLT